MSSRLFAVFAFGFLALSTLSFNSTEGVLRVAFPVPLLDLRGDLVDPRNLHSVYHFYLLENLASGLVRDSARTHTKYEGVLSESWEQTAEDTWRFQIRPQLKWSDGTPMTGAQLSSHFLALAKRPSRHLVTFRRLKTVLWNSDANALTLVFNGPTNDSVLHELSLADALVVHPDGNLRWTRTSGHYRLAPYEPAHSSLQLIANVHHPLFSPTYPSQVELIQPQKRDWTSLAEEEFDLWLAYPPSYSALNSARIAAGPRVLEGPETAIYHFFFNPEHPLAQSREARQSFASLVGRFFKQGIPPLKGIQYEAQFSPPGYPTRLEPEELPHWKSTSALMGESIHLAMYYFAEEFPWLSSSFVSFLEDNGVNVTPSYEVFKKPPPMDYFASVSVFIGNQKDSLGSWAFQLEHPNAPLFGFRSVLVPLLEAAQKTSVNSERESLLLALHRKCLEEALIIPFMRERRYTVHSSRVSLRRTNPFDMRLRFYEVDWE